MPEGSIIEGVLCSIVIVTAVTLILVLSIDFQDTKNFNHYFKETPNETNIFNATANFTY